MHLLCRCEMVHFCDFPCDHNVHNDIINPTRQRNVITPLQKLFNMTAHQIFNLWKIPCPKPTRLASYTARLHIRPLTGNHKLSLYSLPLRVYSPGQCNEKKNAVEIKCACKKQMAHISCNVDSADCVFLKTKLLNRVELLLSLPAVITQFSPYAVCFTDGGTIWQLHYEFIRTSDSLTAIWNGRGLWGLGHDSFHLYITQHIWLLWHLIKVYSAAPLMSYDQNDKCAWSFLFP